MAHEIDMSNDRANMAYTGLKGWHGLGHALPPDADMETWRVSAGMNWVVNEAGVLYKTVSNGTDPLVFSGKKILYRSDTNAPLSVVGSEYKVVQPTEVLNFFKELISTRGYTLETAGCLYGGRKFWALARTGKTVTIGQYDGIAPYLLMATSCDGSMSSSAFLTSVRVVCDNTLQTAIGSGANNARIRIPHSSVFDMDKVHAALGIVDGSWDTFIGNITKLTTLKLSPTEAIKIVADELKQDWVDVDGKPMSVAAMLETSKLLRRVFKLYNGEGLGSEWDTSKGTAWGLVNAVTQYCDHGTGSKRTDGSTSFERAHLGDRAEFKTRIANKLLALV